MKPRTKARSIALQSLYEIDIAGHQINTVLENRLTEENLNPDLAKFVRIIVSGVWPIVDQLDELIIQHAPDWPLEQVATIDRNILRISLWEFAVYKDTPLKVAINEAVELAKLYGSDSSPRFINGVLGSVSNQLNEIQQVLNKIIDEKEEQVTA